ncbi:MAG: hypothetical protein D6800_14165 [Candidatus Zixiibacteriota bacterium]|nr:MAG: hypothetical protein D6800_14165 [candidate division Zixibacteria bacterium]
MFDSDRPPGYPETVNWAVVTTNILDMLAEPRFGAERVNQLLFGHLVRVGTLRKGYFRVTARDGYVGWADKRFLRHVSEKEATRYSRGPFRVVVRGEVKVTDRHGRTVSPHRLYYGTRLRVASVREGRAKVLLPAGEQVFYVNAGALQPIPKTKRLSVTGREIVRETRKFLGVPYLWGGVTTTGCDCSGLVQTVFGRFGVDLPRDTRDQIRAGVSVGTEELVAGDLVFFDRHVAIACGGGRIIHASVGGGGVRLNSLWPGEPDYRKDLAETLQTARRVLV